MKHALLLVVLLLCTPHFALTASPAGSDEDQGLLRLAAQGTTEAIGRLVARHPAAVQASDANGNTALHFAARTNTPEAIAVLLKSAADPNAANAAGDTPLHVAMREGRAQAAEALMRGGADPRLKDAQGSTPAALWKAAGTAPAPKRGQALGQSPPDPRALVDGNLTPVFLVPSGNKATARCRYTTEEPSGRWAEPAFDDAGWRQGALPFGSTYNADEWCITWWDTPQLWVRRVVNLPEMDFGTVELFGRHDDGVEVYFNGVLAYRNAEWAPGQDYFRVASVAAGALHPGENVIAVHVTNTQGGGYLDFGLVRDPMLDLPTAGGEANPRLAALSMAVRRFMVKNNIPAGTLAVMKGDRVVVSRAFGWADKEKRRALAPGAIMRLASNDKVITSIALRELIDRGALVGRTRQRLSYGARLLTILEAYGITPPPTMDPRWRQVTLEQLWTHTSGCPDLPPLAEMRRRLNDTGAWSATKNVQFLLTQPLREDPGTTNWYNSNGYLLLRYVMQLITGDLEGFLRDDLFASCGTRDVRIASEALSGRDTREPFYATCEWPYDRHPYLEHYYGLSASAEGMVRLYRWYHMGGLGRLIDPATGRWAARPDNGGGIFFGGMAGTASVTVQRRYDEVSYAVLFNKGAKLDPLADELNAMVDALPAEAWR